MSKKIVRASVAIGGVPLVYADGEYARCRAEFDLRVPGRYIMTIGEAPRCAVFDVTVDEPGNGEAKRFRFHGLLPLRHGCRSQQKGKRGENAGAHEY